MKTDDAILKEVFDNNMIGTETKIKKAISLTRQTERKRILELIEQFYSDNIDFSPKMREALKKEVRRNDR